jgi:hypothetical protein
MRGDTDGCSEMPTKEIAGGGLSEKLKFGGVAQHGQDTVAFERIAFSFGDGQVYRHVFAFN